MAMSRNNFNAHKNDDDKIYGAQSACAQDSNQKCCVCEQVVVAESGARGC
jgi:hypothetical protein